MSSGLSTADYITILKYYNQVIPKSKRLLRIRAETIMANKLCKCIKKIDNTHGAKAPPIPSGGF